MTDRQTFMGKQYISPEGGRHKYFIAPSSEYMLLRMKCFVLSFFISGKSGIKSSKHNLP